jgi:hypothetical protein
MSQRRYIQDKLTSGSNIKTINGSSILGSGNLVVGGSFSGTMDDIANGTTYVKTENNYTDSEVTKLAGIASGAEVNVNADWNAISGDSQILNKPTISGTNTGDNAINTLYNGLLTIQQQSKIVSSNITIQANYSAIVTGKYKVNSGIKLVINSDATLRIL